MVRIMTMWEMLNNLWLRWLHESQFIYRPKHIILYLLI